MSGKMIASGKGAMSSAGKGAMSAGREALGVASGIAKPVYGTVKAVAEGTKAITEQSFLAAGAGLGAVKSVAESTKETFATTSDANKLLQGTFQTATRAVNKLGDTTTDSASRIMDSSTKTFVKVQDQAGEVASTTLDASNKLIASTGNLSNETIKMAGKFVSNSNGVIDKVSSGISAATDTSRDIARDISGKIRYANSLLSSSITQRIDEGKQVKETRQRLGNIPQRSTILTNMMNLIKEVELGINTRLSAAATSYRVGCTGIFKRTCPPDKTQKFLDYQQKTRLLLARLTGIRRSTLLELKTQQNIDAMMAKYTKTLDIYTAVNNQSETDFNNFLDSLQNESKGGTKRNRKRTRRKKLKRTLRNKY